MRGGVMTPCKGSKKDVRDHYLLARKTYTAEQMFKAIQDYVEKTKDNDYQFIRTLANFMKNEDYVQYIESPSEKRDIKYENNDIDL
jgi:hypothetical protein